MHFQRKDITSLILLLGLCITVWTTPATAETLAIFKETGIARLSSAGAASPEKLSEMLREEGFDVIWLDAEGLASSEQLDREKIDLLILPYGEYFPAAAVSNFKRYLKQGGKFISLGGYAFRKQVRRSDSGWNIVDEPSEILGTERLLPNGIEKNYAPDQIPIFDLDYPLEYVERIVANKDQTIFSEGIDVEDSFSGWAACVKTGSNKGRYIPLLECRDRYGRYRGSAFSLVRVFPEADPDEGDFPALKDYSGTSWAFSGINSEDLLSLEEPVLKQGFLTLIDRLIEDVYIGWAESGYYCYRQGETPTIAATLCNGGKRIAMGKARVRIFEEGQVVFQSETPCSVGIQKRSTVQWEWEQDTFDNDFYEFEVTLYDESDQIIDSYQSAFVIWDSEVLSSGPPVRMVDNYLTGYGKNRLMFGVDEAPDNFMLYLENPLLYRSDMQLRRDGGIDVYENLQQYLWWSEQAYLLTDPVRREKHLRKVDAIVQLCQKYDSIYQMGTLISVEHNKPDKELAPYDRWMEILSERYADVPGLIWYLNGDFRCPTIEPLTVEWNLFLREKYKTDEALRKAWGELAPEQPIGEIPAEDHFLISPHARGWKDVKAYDTACFRAWLIRRWTQRFGDIVRKFDQEKPITCEFYHTPGGSDVDVPMGMEHLDFSNIGFFTNADECPPIMAYSDCRSRNKSSGIGEFGGRTHPLYDYCYFEPLEMWKYYLAIPHILYGAGSNHVYNWCWKDVYTYPFPWGLLHNDQTPRTIYYTFRNSSFFLRTMPPEYRPPSVGFLESDSLRLSAMQRGWRAGHWSVVRGMECLLSAQPGEMLTLNEAYLEIPESVKLIYYPLAFTVPDDVYERLLNFVQEGGTLYVSGDPCYDLMTRERTKPERLERLCGVKSKEVHYSPQFEREMTSATAVHVKEPQRQLHGCAPLLSISPVTAQPIYVSQDTNEPIVVENRLGKGRVIYNCDPCEFKITRVSDHWSYRLKAAEWANKGKLTLKIDTFVRDLSEDGSAHFTLYQHSEKGTPLPGGFPVEISEENEWKTIKREFDINPECRSIQISMGFHNHLGEAFFDNLSVTAGGGEVVLKQDFNSGVPEGWSRQGQDIIEWLPESDVSESGVMHIQSRVPGETQLTERQRTRQNANLYREIMKTAGQNPIQVEPYDPGMKIYRMPVENGGRAYVFQNFATDSDTMALVLREEKSEIEIEIGAGLPGVLHFGNDGQLVGVENDSLLKVNGTERVDNHAHAMIFSLDGKALDESNTIGILPNKQGSVEIYGASRWNDPVFSLGEPVDGVWKTYERIPAAIEKNSIRLNIDEQQSTTMIVLGEKDDVEKNIQLLLKTIAFAPEKNVQ